MTQDRTRLSDPASLVSRMDAAMASIESLDTLIADLTGAKERLATFERNLKAAISGAERVVVEASQTTGSMAERSEAILTELGRALVGLNEAQSKSQREVERTLVELGQGQARTLGALENKATHTLTEVDEALAIAEEAVRSVRAESETFRREQLTKLEDLQASHRMLSDRQRENEAHLQDEMTRQQERLEGLAAKLREDFTGLIDRVSQTAETVVQIQTDLTSSTLAHADSTRAVRRLGIVSLAIAGLSFFGLVAIAMYVL